jgi:hypothetical protein
MKWMRVVEDQNSWRVFMTERTLTIPEIILIAGTRVALGVGVGLLIADRLDRDASQAAGVALLAVGALTAIPIVAGLLGKPQVAVRG